MTTHRFAWLAAACLFAVTTITQASDKPTPAPRTGIKAASCTAKAGGPSQCSAGEKCINGQCAADMKGPKTGPIERR